MKFDYRFLAAIPIVTIPAIFMRSIFIAAVMIIATIMVSYFSKRTRLKKFGLELVTFTTVLIGVMFGALPGAIVGAVLILLHDVITGRIASYLLIVVPFFGVIGAIAGTFASVDIITLGVGLALLSHLVFIFSRTIAGRFPISYIPYFAFNMLFNFFLFSNVAPKLLGLF